MTVEQQRQDLAQLRFTLERAHPGLYRYSSQRATNQRFDRVARSIRQPVTNLEFYRRLVPVISAIRDSHTSIQPAVDLQRLLRSDSQRVFPLDIRYIEGRMYVEADLRNTTDRVTPGSEVLAIDGHPAIAVTDRLAGELVVDGYNRQSQLDRLDANFWYHYNLQYGSKARYLVRLRDIRTNSIRELCVEGIPPRRLIERETGTVREPQRLELLNDGTAILTLDELFDARTGDFLRQAFARIAAAHPTDLIIDLRKCPGGEDRFNNQLLSFLVDHPFRFYWSRGFSVRSYDDLKYIDYSTEDFFEPELLERLPPTQRVNPIAALDLPDLLRAMLSTDGADGVFQPAPRDRFSGRVYLLVTGMSASSAAEIAAIMHHLGLGTIIGEEPLGVYQGLTAGAIPILTLPNSGVRVRIPLISYHNAVVEGVFIGRAAPPAFPVSQSLADAIAGKDTIMDFTKRLIEARRQGEMMGNSLRRPAPPEMTGAARGRSGGDNDDR